MFMRLFIALSIPEKIREILYEKAENLKKKELFNGKITEEENIHLTLKFLGDIQEDALEAIIKRLGEIKMNKISVIIGNFGVFDEKFVRIIWVKLLGIDELQKEVDRSLRGLFQQEDRFMSHITIARLKSVKEKRSLIDEIKNIKLSNIKFQVDSFELMKSELNKEGADYSVVEKFELF